MLLAALFAAVLLGWWRDHRNYASRQRELLRACAERYGEDAARSLVCRMLILHACEQEGIAIGEKDIDEEISRLAQKFGLDADGFHSLLERDRGISREEYREDIIRPVLGMKEMERRNPTRYAALKAAVCAQFDDVP